MKKNYKEKGRLSIQFLSYVRYTRQAKKYLATSSAFQRFWSENDLKNL